MSLFDPLENLKTAKKLWDARGPEVRWPSKKWIVAENPIVFRAWCIDHDLDPTEVRGGHHPDYFGVFLAYDPSTLNKVHGLDRGLKYIRVGTMPSELYAYLTQSRIAVWVDD